MIVINDLIKEIERAIDDLQEETYPPFFKDLDDFVSRKRVTNVKQLSEFSIDDVADFFLLTAQGIINNKIYFSRQDETDDELEELIAKSWARITKAKDTIKALLSKYSFEDMVFLRDVSLYLNNNEVENIKKQLLDDNPSVSVRSFIDSIYELLGKDKLSGRTPEFIRSIKEKGLEQETVSFLSEFANEFRNTYESCAFDILIGYIYVKHKYLQICAENGLNRRMRRLNQECIDTTVEEDTEDLRGYQAVFSAYSGMKKYINNYGARTKEKNSQIAAKREIYKKVLARLRNAEKKSEITNINELVRGLSDDDPIKKKIVLLVAEHNKAEYDRLLETYNELVSKDINVYRSIFFEHGISISDDEICALIASNGTSPKSFPSPEDTNQILDLLKWFSPDEKLNILKTTSLERAKTISQFVSSGYCSVEFIKNHLDIYNLNSNTYDKYTNALTLLSDYGINPRVFINSADVLLSDNQLLENNAEILARYGLLSCLKTASNLSFFSSIDIASKIDTFIELGLIDLLENRMDILNFDDSQIKRLRFLYAINGYMLVDEDGEPIVDWDKLLNEIYRNDFFANEEEIDACLLNEFDGRRKFNISFQKDSLQQKRGDPRITIIGGVVFSTEKIKRRLEAGDNIYDAIFYNKLCSDEEIERIEEELKQIQKKYE